jgi:hypothetical protein
MKRVLLLAALALGSAAQDEKRADVVTGQVLEAGSGEPVRKVQVTLQPVNPQPVARAAAGLMTLTNAEGKFRLHSVKAGKYVLQFTKQGWVSDERAPRTWPVEVREGTPVPPTNLKLRRAGAIAGRVLDRDGDPMPGVSLMLQAVRRSPSPSERKIPMGWANTDDRGEYRIANIAPGRYRVLANPVPDWNPVRLHLQRQEDAGAEEIPSPTYYPGVVDLEGAGILQVSSGQEVHGIEIRLATAPAFRISGRLSGVPSASVQPPVVFLRSVGDMYSQVGRPPTPVSDKGEFELLGVRAGKYVLAGRAASADGAVLGGTLDLDLSGSIDGVTLELKQSMSVTGKVSVPEGRKLARPFVLLQEMSDLPMMGATSAPAEPDGSFTIKNVVPGNYSVSLTGGGMESAAAMEGLWLASVTQGTSEIKDKILRVSAGMDPVLLRMEEGAPEVRVTVAGDKPVGLPGAAAILYRENAEAGLQRPMLCITDGTGQCSLKGLEPGEYLALAIFPFEGIDIRDRGLLAEFKQQVKQVKVAKGERAAVELKANSLE